MEPVYQISKLSALLYKFYSLLTASPSVIQALLWIHSVLAANYYTHICSYVTQWTVIAPYGVPVLAPEACEILSLNLISQSPSGFGCDSY